MKERKSVKKGKKKEREGGEEKKVTCLYND